MSAVSCMRLPLDFVEAHRKAPHDIRPSMDWPTEAFKGRKDPFAMASFFPSAGTFMGLIPMSGRNKVISWQTGWSNCLVDRGKDLFARLNKMERVLKTQPRLVHKGLSKVKMALTDLMPQSFILVCLAISCVQQVFFALCFFLWHFFPCGNGRLLGA